MPFYWYLYCHKWYAYINIILMKIMYYMKNKKNYDFGLKYLSILDKDVTNTNEISN